MIAETSQYFETCSNDVGIFDGNLIRLRTSLHQAVFQNYLNRRLTELDLEFEASDKVTISSENLQLVGLTLMLGKFGVSSHCQAVFLD
jgi:hypothetical protein